MKVEFVDLARQNKKYKKKYLKIFNSYLTKPKFIQGPDLELFESNFSRFLGKKYCIGLNSGTDALFFALIAYGIGPGDEVITAPNSYFSTAMVASHLGATVVFADVNPDTHTIDSKKVTEKITKKTKAIIPIHLYGQSADMDPLLTLAQKHNLVIIEDACQAHGAKYKDQIVPYTETGAFSFYPGKNLGCFGDGGALVTDNQKIAEKVYLLRNDGSKIKYQHELFGYKSRLDTINAAILNLKLSYLTKWNKKRRKAAQLYTKLLASVNGITTPVEAPYAYHSYHLYVIETDERDALQKYLSQHKIATVIHYPTPIHLQVPYRKLGHSEKEYPISELKSKRILSLPMFPEIKTQEIEFIVDKIRRFMKSRKTNY